MKTGSMESFLGRKCSVCSRRTGISSCEKVKTSEQMRSSMCCLRIGQGTGTLLYSGSITAGDSREMFIPQFQSS
ncbi:hypothetical protein DPMN_181067 [Dreissena polymorpha]|uniref:Uncharacterized protein n=1 Tax=Dreissena polymorpha TaxID=45954 RepID=A0A9D4DBM5_DREPO|nr:hypothetical protein DPMN_181067 [Dreissena polymorpha]